MKARLVSVALVIGVAFLVGGSASAARSYTDRVGDPDGPAPDIASATVSNTRTKLTFRIRFATTPPLDVSESEGWVDMLLIGVDVPPLGKKPIPGGDWRGANYALATHGPSPTGYLVRVGPNIPPASGIVARFKVLTRGRTVTFSVARRALGNPAWFRFLVAAGREMEAGGGSDFAPDSGTYRYAFDG